MNDELPSAPDLTNIDLSLSFAPAWVKEASNSQNIARLAAKHGDADHRGGDRPERRGTDRRPRMDRPRPPRQEGGGDRARSFQRSAPPEPKPVPTVRDWEVRFLPHPNGVEGLTKQIKTSVKAYSLFDLAQLVLEKSERYQVEFKKASSSAQPLYQLKSDGSVWTSESEAVTHALAQQLDTYYRRDRITVEAPKGNYTVVAVCGISGVLLGPPNYHDYQEKIRRVHAAQASNIPFETYKNRIRTERDPAMIEKWKEEQSSKDVFYPTDTPEGMDPVKLESLADVERHFRAHYLSDAVRPLPGRAVVPGPAALNESAPGVLALTRNIWEELHRFPLPLAHNLGEQLASKGLHIFKAQKNMTFVGPARPRYLDRQATPVSEKLQAILAYLENHANTPRAEQWKALIELYPTPEEGSSDTREATMATDLFWLLHEGHVVDYAGRGLVATRKPENKPQGPSSPKKAPANETAPELS
jgi:hypothetical protein